MYLEAPDIGMSKDTERTRTSTSGPILESGTTLSTASSNGVGVEYIN